MDEIDVNTLLGRLPAFQGKQILIHPDQEVKHIIVEILESHYEFRKYYDSIALYFDAPTTGEICDKLYSFCKKNIAYEEQPKEYQNTGLPTELLTLQKGDCKHYATFCGGVLDAINRLTGKKIKWWYRFASYKIGEQIPYHVFIVVQDKGQQIWIDPTPGANNMTPVWYIDKKVKPSNMALYRTVAGIDDAADVDINNYEDLEIIPDLPDADDKELTPDLLHALDTLLFYEVIDQEGNMFPQRVEELSTKLSDDQFLEVINAWQFVEQKSIGGFFSSIWRGVKKLTLAPIRGAFLSAVALNVFGMATKMKQATKTQSGIDKVRGKWYAFGGDWAKLRQAIDNGAKRKKIGGTVGVAPVIPAWVATAGAIIAAIMPIVTAILKQQKAAGMDMSDLENQYGSGSDDPYKPTPGTGGPLEWIQENPIPTALIGALAVNFILPPAQRFIKI